MNKLLSCLYLFVFLITACSSPPRPVDTLTDDERDRINLLTLNHWQCLFEKRKEFLDSPREIKAEDIVEACDRTLDKIEDFMGDDLNLDQEYVGAYVKAIRKEGLTSTAELVSKNNRKMFNAK